MKYCDKCNAPVPDEDSFCKNCGMPINGDSQLKKKSKKKKILKTLLIIIGVWIALNIFVVIVGIIFADTEDTGTTTVISEETQEKITSNNNDDSTISSPAENDDSDWVRLTDTSLGYGYKKTPEDFISEINKFFEILCANNNDDSNNYSDFFGSLEFLKKYEKDNCDEYIYEFSESGGNLGYFIDYYGTYIGEAKSVISSEVVNNNPGYAKDALCVGVVSILYAYGEIDEESEIDNCWSLVSRIGAELSSKIIDYPDSTASYCRYGDYVIVNYSDEQYTVQMSVYKSDSESIELIESVAGYTLVDVK